MSAISCVAPLYRLLFVLFDHHLDFVNILLSAAYFDESSVVLFLLDELLVYHLLELVLLHW